MMLMRGIDKMEFLTCELCEKDLIDWKGHVMAPINSHRYQIEDLQIWCTECCSESSDVKFYEEVIGDIAKLNWGSRFDEILNSDVIPGRDHRTRIRDNMLMVINKKR